MNFQDAINSGMNMNNIDYELFVREGIIAEKQEPCEDAISRAEAIRIASGYCHWTKIPDELAKLPPVTPKQNMGRCKDCKYFEYDSVAKVDGIPLIVAHEICSRWGDGCKTKEDGYCFLFEQQESEGNNEANL